MTDGAIGDEEELQAVTVTANAPTPSTGARLIHGEILICRVEPPEGRPPGIAAASVVVRSTVL